VRQQLVLLLLFRVTHAHMYTTHQSNAMKRWDKRLQGKHLLLTGTVLLVFILLLPARDALAMPPCLCHTRPGVFMGEDRLVKGKLPLSLGVVGHDLCIFYFLWGGGGGGGRRREI